MPGACPFPTSVDLGTHNIGDTFAGSVSGSNGGFTPGSVASIVLDNQAAGTKVVDARGCIDTTHQILSGPRDNVDDVVAANCGSNQLVATQNGHQGLITFRINCVAAAAAAGRVAFTGANVLRWGLAALALIGVGVLLVLGARRRRTAI